VRSRRKEETEREDRRERHRDGKGMWGEKGNRRERHRDGRECGEKRETGEKDTGMEGNVGRKGTGSKEAGKEREMKVPL